MVALHSQIYVMALFPEVVLVTYFKNRDNQLGIFGVNYGNINQMLAFPGRDRAGSIEVSLQGLKSGGELKGALIP